MKYISDTNTLLHNPEILKEYEIVIPSHVFREIEHLELVRRSDDQLQYEIRRFKRMMDENELVAFEDLNDYTFKLDKGKAENVELDGQYTDNILIQVAVQNNYGMITNDRLLRNKCRLYGVETISPINKNLDMYQGYKFVDLTTDELMDFYEDMSVNTFDLLTNQYLIVRDENQNTKDKFRWNGKRHVKLKLPKYRDKRKEIIPENDLQECALDLLNNDDIPVKFILGTYGSGKTFLATKIAVNDVEELGNHAKIMMVRNPIGTGEQIGFLAGDKKEKTAGFFKPIIQHLESGEQTATVMEMTGKLVAEIPYYMKGLSIGDAFMIVDEAEDLTTKLIKLIGTRLSENAVVAFCGDVNQAEEKYIRDNGLVRAVEALKGKDMVGVVVLDIDVRSEASKLFADF